MRLSGVARAEALLMASNAVYRRSVWASFVITCCIRLDLMPLLISLSLRLSRVQGWLLA